MSAENEAARLREQADALEKKEQAEGAEWRATGGSLGKATELSALDLIGKMTAAELEQFIVRAVKKAQREGRW